MRAEHLSYFRDLFEGRAEISWRAWFKQNDAQLVQELPRPAYLRLKFHMLDEAEKLLRQAGIEFTHSPKSKREKYYSLLHESVLDERGRPKDSFRREAYNGAFGAFLDGNHAKAKETLTELLREICHRSMERIEEQELDGFCFDGELEFEYGDRELGRMMLELVAAIDIENDLLGPSIFRARELLSRELG